MSNFKFVFSFWVALLTTSATQSFANAISADDLRHLPVADIYILGEIHDNPTHHARQAQVLADLTPSAVVYEMLSEAEAEELSELARAPSTMAEAASGMQWPNLADYAGVLAASPIILGAAVPRDEAREVFASGAAAQFQGDAELFGLSAPLPADQLEERKQLQFTAHCDAMPMEMMGGMVEAQRLRDAAFSKAVIDAFDTHGGPVVLITGNGHARKDWGVPAFLAKVRPELRVFSLGQFEEPQQDAPFDAWIIAPPAAREDPCAAFN